MCSCSLKLFLLVLILSIAFWIVKFLDCYEPTWANLSQLEPTCGPKWPNGAAHAHAYCIIRAGNGNCWASVSATINLYFKHVTCSQDTLKMASSTQTKKIHVPMVSIVRNSLKFWLGLKSLWLKPVTDEITPVSLLIHWSCGFAGAWWRPKPQVTDGRPTPFVIEVAELQVHSENLCISFVCEVSAKKINNFMM